MDRHYYNLDLIKILAAVCIVFHHYQQLSGTVFGGVNFFNGTFNYGYLVELFFIISGFLMVHGHTQKNGAYDLIHKVIRIYPSAICACIAYIIIWIIYKIFCNEYLLGEKFGIIQVIASLLLVHQGWAIDILPAINNPTWYLCVLILCYIVYYFINYFAYEKRIAGFALIVVISTISFKFGISLPFFRLLTQRGYSSFFVGCLLYILLQTISLNKIKIISIALLAASGIFGYILKFSNWYNMVFLFFPGLILLATSIRQIHNKKIVFLSGTSFEVYLWHVPLYGLYLFGIKILGVTIEHTYVTMLLFALSVELFAAFFYKYFEIPIVQNLNKLYMIRNKRKKSHKSKLNNKEEIV